MSKDKVVVGVDIGSSKITTVITTVQNDSSVNVIGVSTLAARGLRKGQSLEAAERMAGYSVGTAFISVDGVHIESQNSKGVVAIADASCEITTEDVTRVIEAARAISLPSSREILHVIPRYFVVDSQSGIKDPLGMTCVRMEVETHIITGATTALR